MWIQCFSCETVCKDFILKFVLIENVERERMNAYVLVRNEREGFETTDVSDIRVKMT